MSLSTFPSTVSNATTLAANGTMRGVVWQGIPNSMAVVDLPIPRIQNATDVLVRVTAATICGSDLHFYHGTFGHAGAVPPWGMGHEAVGYVTDIGQGVNNIAVGDRVVIPDILNEAHIGIALTHTLGPTFGVGGGLGGCQAEYVRVPYADANLIAIPPATGNETASDLDWAMLSDIFPTAWQGLDFAGFQSGDTVAIWGAGPVGLLSAYSANIRGASRVYIVDHVQERLDIATSIGAIPIDFTASDPVDQILALEPQGVARSVDCVGYEAVNANLVQQENIVINQMIQATMQSGGLGGIGVWPSMNQNSSAAPLAATINVTMSMEMGQFFAKRLSLRGGAVDVTSITPLLAEMISTGKAKPGFVVEDVIDIEDAPNAYAKFDRHETMKVAIRFPWH